jgi:hypothetical protein
VHLFYDAAYNVVAGNRIGTDVTGAIPLGNGLEGVSIRYGAYGNRIGTNGDGLADAAEGNTISGNAHGVVIESAGTHDNLVAGNFIGTDASGTQPLGNVWYGVVVLNWIGDAVGPYANQVGGAQALGNTIAHNGAAGVLLFSDLAVGNRIRGNAIFLNGGLGIDLAGDGPTLNDPGDFDTGPNNLQNFPVMTLAEPGATTHLAGTLNSTPNTIFTIDFYDNTSPNAAGFVEGERYLGSIVVTTDASGNATFDVTLPVATALGELITATATDPEGNTSEFSRRTILTNPPVADAGGPYEIREGDPLVLDGRGSFDPDAPCDSIVKYEWDLDNDGRFGDAESTGPLLELTPEMMERFGFNHGPREVQIALRVTDSFGATATDTALVSILNVPPVAADDGYFVDEDHTLAVAALGGLDNDTDVVADRLTAVLVSGPTHGTLALAADGSFAYVPDLNFNGVDSFTYRAFDGDEYSDPATVTITVHSVIDAVIDIKPGSFPNSINLGSKGVLPVAILSTQKTKGELEDFDARLVDVATILFGDSREGYGRVRPIRSAFEDVDGDGDLDLILHFDMQQIVRVHALDATSVDAALSAETLGGDANGFDLSGIDLVRIVPSAKDKNGK